MSLKRSFAIAAVFISGFFTDSVILPALYPEQKPIDETTLTGLYQPEETAGIFHNAETQSSAFAETAKPQSNVLGYAVSEKRIDIDLTHQRLYAFEGGGKIYDFPISSGKWYPTPTGEFRIWIKLRYTKMEGGNPTIGTYYNLPNVPYTMYFANADVPTWRGFGIHGAYWHNNFGYPMSHGCINMRPEDAAVLYYWAAPALGDKPSIRATPDNPGTRVVIYGETPDT